MMLTFNRTLGKEIELGRRPKRWSCDRLSLGNRNKINRRIFMTRLVEFTSEEGTIYIEVDEKLPLPKPKPEDELISLTDEIAVKAAQSFEDALNGIKPVANAIINKVKSLNEPADQVEVKFGIKMTVGLGAIIASGSADVNYEITLKWDNKEKNKQSSTQ
jgi:hypothetical protein